MPILRTLRRSPAFTASAIITLALGTGANTGALSALNTLLLKPLPYPEPQRLVSLYETAADRKPRGVAEANLLDWQRRSTRFEAMAAYQPRSFGLTLSQHDPVIVIQTGMVMASFFPAVGVPPALGRTFSEAEEIAEAPRLVLTDRLWRRLFAGDPATVGRKVWINEAPYTIVGVMPAGFEFPIENVLPDAFLPLSRRDYCCGRLGSQSAIGRLKKGVSLNAGRAELEASAAALAEQFPATNRNRSAGLRPLEATMHGARRDPLGLLLAAAGLLLAIAAANVAGLILTRTLARGPEIAIRAALGASLPQLARQFVAEAAVLSFAGGMAGLLAARAVLRVVPAFLPGPAERVSLKLDGAALGFAIASAFGLTVLLGLAPLLKARSILSFRPTPSGTRLRNTVVMAQVALSVILLLGTGLLLHSFLRLLATDPGFTTAHALRFGIGLPEARYDTDEKLIGFHRDLLARLGAISGVEKVGAAVRTPLRGGDAGPGGVFQIAGSGIPVPQRPRAWVNSASPGYFAAMNIPLLAGRDFSWRDDTTRTRRVAIVNRSFGETYLHGRQSVGTLLDFRNATWEVIGVVGDTRQANLDRAPLPEIIVSMTQDGADGAGYVIRARTDDPALPKAISEAVAKLDPRIQRITPAPLRLIIDKNLEARSTAIRLVGTFGALALLLTAVGIYGIVALRAAERSREIAIRMALGASARHVRGLLLGHAFRLTAGGIAAGLTGFLLFGRFLRGQPYGIGMADPATIALVSATILIVALAAAAWAGRGAADPGCSRLSDGSRR